MNRQHIIILGGGQAGLQAALSLRELGFSGTVSIITNEPGLPYQRPPLSKGYLLGKMRAGDLALRPADVLAQQNIALIAGEAISIDRRARQLTLADGQRLTYDRLIIATGSRGRMCPLPGADLPGIYTLRSKADADALGAGLALLAQAGHKAPVLIMGGGFIGLEFAAVATESGFACTVVERGTRLLERALSPESAGYLQQYHEQRGVRFHLATQVAGFCAGEQGRVGSVRLTDGSTLAAQLVLVGIGGIANDELAAASGLACDNGIRVNACLQTSDDAIFAIGDCARAPHPLAPAGLRLESVGNAIDQGRLVAANVLGEGKVWQATPWFWSDQGREKIQMVGLGAACEQSVIRGEVGQGRFSVFCFQNEQLRAVESINRPVDHMMARKWLEQGLSPTLEQLADPNWDPKSLGKSSATPPVPG